MLSKSEIATRITRNPGIYGGKPIIRGTRMPVDLIVDFLSNGDTAEEILDNYPDLTIEDIEAAVAFSEDEVVQTEIRPWDN
jgi:uncharacterized protein (DUF433 family)